MRHQLLEPLLAERPQKLGVLGPCTFESVLDFFTRSAPSVPPRWQFDNSLTKAIGDIHGDLLVLLTALYMLQVIDSSANWKGGEALVVLCGDLLDSAGRGCKAPSRNEREEVDILQYLHALNVAAQKEGGAVVAVMGNHELFRIVHYKPMLQYRSPEQIKGWGGEEQHDRLFAGPARRYFALHFPLFVRCKSFVFLHANVPESVMKHRKEIVDEDQRRNFIKNLNGLFFTMLIQVENNPKQHPLFGSVFMPMLVNRDFLNPKADDVTKQEQICQRHIAYILYMFDAKGVVVGHSIQDRFKPYCNGKVWRIDFGMSRAFCKPTPQRVMSGLSITQNPSASFVDVYRCIGKKGRFMSQINRYDLNGKRVA